ncbi:MAG: glutaredoxin family protein [Gammaproteobacteria bacterium]
MARLRFTVYSRPLCHLCDEMLTELRPLLEGTDADLEVVDVDGDEDLRIRYGHKVPVLVVDDEEVCHFRLIPERVTDLLDQA